MVSNSEIKKDIFVECLYFKSLCHFYWLSQSRTIQTFIVGVVCITQPMLKEKELVPASVGPVIEQKK